MQSKRCLNFGKEVNRKQIQVTDAEDKSSDVDESMHNNTYCRNWVQQSALNTGKGDISCALDVLTSAQSDVQIHDTENLADVTSVSRNVPEYRKKTMAKKATEPHKKASENKPNV